MIGELTTAAVVTILEQLGYYNPPDWLVYALLAAATVEIIVMLLTGVGIVTIPAWAIAALDAATAFHV